jgi:hypothetical protein
MRRNKNKYLLKFFVAIISFLLSIPLFAQYKPWNYNKFHIAVQGGVSWPYDRFGTGHNVKYASFVNKGYNVVLQTAYYYSPNYGYGINLIWNEHSVNNEKLAEEYLKNKPAYKTAVANVGSFYMPTVTAGMYFQIPINEYFAFTATLHAGLQAVVKPAGTVNITTTFSTITIEETGFTTAKFVWYYKFGMQFRVAPKVHAVVDAAYTGATYQFEYKRNNEDISEPQHIGDVMYRIGVAYKFN